MACRSFCGFQSESKRIHVSAAVKLIPAPKPRDSISSDPDGGHHQSSSGAIRAHPAAISGSTYAPRARREEEGECGRSRLAEAIDGGLAEIARDRAVQSLKRVSTGIEELREDVEHDRELSRGGEGGRGRGGEGDAMPLTPDGEQCQSISINCQSKSINLKQSQSISIHQQTCEKMSTRCPSERSFGRSFERRMSFPLAESIAPRAAASSMPIVTCGERVGAVVSTCMQPQPLVHAHRHRLLDAPD